MTSPLPSRSIEQGLAGKGGDGLLASGLLDFLVLGSGEAGADDLFHHGILVPGPPNFLLF